MRIQRKVVQQLLLTPNELAQLMEMRPKRVRRSITLNADNRMVVSSGCPSWPVGVLEYGSGWHPMMDGMIGTMAFLKCFHSNIIL